MKTASLVSLALSSGLVAAHPLAVSESHPFGKRQEQNFGSVAGLPPGLASLIPTVAKSGALPMVVKTLINPGYGLVDESTVKGTIAPRTVELKTRNPQIPDSKSVKIRYGPYLVPNMNHANFLGEKGALFNYPDLKVQKPCTGDCLLLGMNADLEYADGSNANIGNGMWLHHMVLFNVGPGRMDPTCVGQLSLPHALIGSDPAGSERLIASGNERSRATFNSPYYPDARLGYFMKPTDQFRLIVDFMNENPVDKTVYMTITYDYVDGRPKGFDNFKSIWFDAAQCGTSEVAPPQQTGKFTIGPVSWTANLDADIMGAGGHLHDGGVAVKLTVDGKVICDSRATYGVTASNGTVTKSGAGGAMAGMGAMRTALESVNSLVSSASDNVLDKRHGEPGDEMDTTKSAHIVAMSPCFGNTIGLTQVKKGQKWAITGDYDYDSYAGMKENGKQSDVMAIAMMFVKNPTF